MERLDPELEAGVAGERAPSGAGRASSAPRASGTAPCARRRGSTARTSPSAPRAPPRAPAPPPSSSSFSRFDARDRVLVERGRRRRGRRGAGLRRLRGGERHGGECIGRAGAAINARAAREARRPPRRRRRRGACAQIAAPDGEDGDRGPLPDAEPARRRRARRRRGRARRRCAAPRRARSQVASTWPWKRLRGRTTRTSTRKRRELAERLVELHRVERQRREPVRRRGTPPGSSRAREGLVGERLGREPRRPGQVAVGDARPSSSPPRSSRAARGSGRRRPTG